MARPKRSSNDPPEIQDLPDLRTFEQRVLAELALMREQMSSLVRYLRTKEAAAIKRRNTLHSRVDKHIVAKHQPTEEEIQQALREQVCRAARRQR